jgi:hypothetical protein
VKARSALRQRTMVLFHKDFRLSPILAGQITFRNKIPETLKPACLCNGMKTPEHEQKLHLDGTAKPGVQKTLAFTFFVARTVSSCGLPTDSLCAQAIPPNRREFERYGGRPTELRSDEA